MTMMKASTKYGIVTGIPGNNPANTIFKGIPYARPPIGELRFAAPQPPESWEGELKCDKWPKICIQYKRQRPMGGPGGPGGHSEHEPVLNEDEDSLYLNIWTPAASKEEKLPVMFWIYGGGFTDGYGFNPTFDGEALNNRGVILVTINYRVGAMGFLALPGLAARDEHHSSGNYGLRDQIAALTWVQENIEAFGGDSDNITIFGQSAGGMSCKFLLCSRLSRGLFRRAIIQSAGGINAADPTRSKEEFWEISQKCLDRLEWSFEDLFAKDAKEINQKLVDTVSDVLEGKEMFFFQPCIDEYVLTELPEKTVYDGTVADADIMCGSVAGDSWMFTRKVRSQLTDNEAALRAFAYSPEVAWARHNGKNGRKPMYTYFFEHNMPVQGGTPHTAELPYVFGTLQYRNLPWENYDFLLSEAMTDYWANFAKSGNPNCAGLPDWPLYTLENPVTMDFTDDGFGAKNLVDNEIAEHVIAFVEEHPGMLESLKDCFY